MANFPFTVQSLQIGQSLLTSTGSTLNIPAGSSIGGLSSGPKISGLIITNISNTQLDDTAIDLSGGYVRLIGTDFQSGCLIYVGQTPAASTTFISATEVRAQLSAQPAGTYILYLINPDGGAAVKVPGITYSASPNWQTGSTLPDMYVSVAITLGLMATNATSYSLISGGLPPGLTLDGNTGVISGSITGITNDTVYSFTIAAIDSENQDSPRVFTLNVRIGDPYFKYTTLLLPGNGTNGAQNNTFLDGSTNNFTITRSGNTTQGTFSPFSQTGWGNYFSGSSQYLTVVDNATLDMGASDFTIEGWVYITATSASQQTLVAKGTGSASSPSYHIALDSSTWKYYLSGNGSTWSIASGVSMGASAGLNTWQHIALVRNGNTFTPYVNGVAGTTTTSSTALFDTTSVLSVAGVENGTQALAGYISNFRIVKGRAVYTSNFTPPTSPPTRTTGGTNPPQGTECSLLTCQSNRFLDSNGPNTPASSPLTITVNGTPSVQAFSPFNPTSSWSAAANGGSGYFDGSGDYLSLSSNAAFTMGTGDFTIECWYYPIVSYASGNGYVCDFGSNGTRIQLYNNNLYFIPVTGSYITGAAGIGIVAGTWYHLAIARSGSTITVYLNGISIGSVTNSSNLTDTNCRIGEYGGGGSGFNGYISSFRIVKGTAVYTSNFTPPTAPLTNITNTSLLLNFTNSGIYDATSRNVLETVGDAKISTAQSRWGGSSMAFDGTGDYLKIPYSPQLYFGSSNWTLEFWFYPLSFTDNNVIFDFGFGSPDTVRSIIFYTAQTSGLLRIAQSPNGSTNYDVSTGITPSLNQWQHIACVRNGSTITSYLNGVAFSPITAYDTYNSTTRAFFVGIQGDLQEVTTLHGHLQDFRITRGYARYTSNFTVPTSAFTTQ